MLSFYYHKDFCNTCKRVVRRRASQGQILLLLFLLFLFMIPGLIYFIVIKPKCCYICGLHIQKDETKSFLDKK